MRTYRQGKLAAAAAATPLRLLLLASPALHPEDLSFELKTKVTNYLTTTQCLFKVLFIKNCQLPYGRKYIR